MVIFDNNNIHYVKSVGKLENLETKLKNKISSPKRKCEFNLIFGQGTYENDQLFDAIRAKGVAVVDTKEIRIEGTGAWKTCTIKDLKTNQVLSEEKFYKSDFTEKILNNPKYVEFIQPLLDASLIKTRGDSSANDEETSETETSIEEKE